jgi:hypothetical protein
MILMNLILRRVRKTPCKFQLFWPSDSCLSTSHVKMVFPIVVQLTPKGCDFKLSGSFCVNMNFPGALVYKKIFKDFSRVFVIISL